MSIEANNSQNNNILLKIKSRYSLQKIFDNLNEIKFLKIIKYNKSLQNKIDKGIIDYKKMNPIIIELIPCKLSQDEEKVFFAINCDQNYRHIYFNDNKEEIERDYFTKDDNVEKIKIVLDYNIYSLNGIFKYCKWIKVINFIKFTRRNITNLNNLFEDSSVEEINFYDFPKNCITNMKGLFAKCIYLKKINFSKFDTSKVTDMSFMFCNCISLPTLCIYNWKTSNVIDMKYMFYHCSSLKYFKIITKFDTSNVIDMSNMFSECEELEELNLSNLCTDNVIDMSGMISKCFKLKRINFHGFNTKNVTKMKNFLSGNISLEFVDLSNFNFDKVIDFENMLDFNESLKRITMSTSQREFAEKFEQNIKEKIIFGEENENIMQNIQPIKFEQNLGIIDNTYTIIELKEKKDIYDIYSVRHNQTQDLHLIEVYKKDLPANLMNIMNNLIALNHPNIICVISHGNGPIILNDNPQRNRPYIVYENFISHSCLFDYIMNQKFTERHAKLIFKKILEGVRAMHNVNICHRNLNVNNILLDENYNPKITDLYFCCMNMNNLRGNVGREKYKAPEVLGNHPYNGKKADIFSLGQILFNLVTGLNGFNAASLKDNYYKLIIRGDLNKYWDLIRYMIKIDLFPEFKDLFIRMVNPNPGQRPKIDDILNHEWFREINDLNEEEMNVFENEVRNELILRENVFQREKQIQQEQRNNLNKFINFNNK